MKQYLLSVLLDTAALNLISRNVGPILTLTGPVTKCTFLCTLQKEHRQALEDFIPVLQWCCLFKLVAGIRKLSNVRDCHLTSQKAPSILSMWRYFFLAVHAVSCYLFCFLYSNPGI